MNFNQVVAKKKINFKLIEKIPVSIFKEMQLCDFTLKL